MSPYIKQSTFKPSPKNLPIFITAHSQHAKSLKTSTAGCIRLSYSRTDLRNEDLSKNTDGF